MINHPILPHLIPLLEDTASEDCHSVLSVPKMNFSARWMKSLTVYQASHLWLMTYSSQEEHVKSMTETCKLHLSDPALKTWNWTQTSLKWVQLRSSILDTSFHLKDWSQTQPRSKRYKTCHHWSIKKELQNMLGMIKCLAKFAPQLSGATKPMRNLLKENVEFIWDHRQDETLKKAKELILSQHVLAYFDPSKSITLQVDASQHGVEGALFQEGRPIAFESKSLSKADEKYAQIEKELYAILFGCKRFHQYVYRHKIMVQKDHKPLESIMKKPLGLAPPHLHRMLLQLQRYNLEVHHVPGKNIPVADVLSRKFMPAETVDQSVGDLDVHIHSIISTLPVLDSKMEQIRLATSEDTQMHDLQTVIQEGWPQHRQNCKESILDCWSFRDELSVINGIILKGQKIFVPKSLRPEMLDKIHTGHLGIEKNIKPSPRNPLLATDCNWNSEKKIASCPICTPTRNSNPREHMKPHEIPDRPWQKVGTDLFTVDNKQYLVTVDYYSRYFEVDELTSTTSNAIIRKLSAHFARHGIPEVAISDNGPQFAAEEFARFAQTWDFKHVTSSPGYPQSNGLAEKTVQTIKNIFKHAKAEGGNALLSILEYRTTPVDGLASSWVVSSDLFCELPPNTWNLRRSTLMKSQPNVNTFKPHKRTTMTGPATKCHLSEPATTYMWNWPKMTIGNQPR